MKDPLQEAFDKYEEAIRGSVAPEAHYKDVESQTKTVLARSFPENGTMKERENAALTSREYQTWIKSVSTAREEYLRARSEVAITEKRWETERSLLSATKRI